MEKLYQQSNISINNLFDGRYYESKILYMYHFNLLPSIQYVGRLNGEKAYKAVIEKYNHLIVSTNQYRWYNRKKRKSDFNETVITLSNNCLLEFNEEYCEILHDGKQQDFLEGLITLVTGYKQRQRRQPQEINLIVKGHYGLELKAMEIKKTKLNIDLFYEDDFKAIDYEIQKRLNKKKDKGIVLLHGLPGTGKTTYLRYLIGKVKKRVLFLSPTIAENLMNPEFIDLLIDNPDTVVVIEDAENILMDRRTNNNSAVSNLLNISDGLLADFLNVQLICTFNSSLTLVDSALLRKGRLIAKYEFGKLGIPKAQQLSNHLGFDTIINRPMTVAEVSNQNQQNFETKQVNVIGFRRLEPVLEN